MRTVRVHPRRLPSIPTENLVSEPRAHLLNYLLQVPMEPALTLHRALSLYTEEQVEPMQPEEALYFLWELEMVLAPVVHLR